MAPNHNIDPGDPGPFNLIFANQLKNAQWPPNNNIASGGLGLFHLMSAIQFKRITRVKLRVSILKVAETLI